jgi:hypothetical protein
VEAGRFQPISRRQRDGLFDAHDRYRFTRWVSRSNGTEQARELYDLQLDPQENENVAERPENRASLKHSRANRPTAGKHVRASCK